MRPFYRFCRFFCHVGFVTFARGRAFHVEKVPRVGGALVAANHQSFFDPVLAGHALPRECHFMGRDSLFRNPAFGWLIRSLNCFPIKRDTADIGAIKETLRRLRDGNVVVAFPEGTRSTDGAVGPLHAGVILIAKKARVPIVPAAITGAYEMWPRDRALPAPGRIYVGYADPISPEELAARTDEECVALVRERIIQLLAELEARRRDKMEDS